MSPSKRKGLVVVNTGEGKGKTTAALGILFRAWGRDMRVCMLQFIKPTTSNYGENRAAKKLGIELVSVGSGFTWLSKDLDEDTALAQHGWEMAKEKLSSGDYDVVILDELTYPITFGWIGVDDVLSALRDRPPALHVVITGRDADQKLVDYADLVTEMRAIKHPYDSGIKAQPGIEF